MNGNEYSLSYNETERRYEILDPAGELCSFCCPKMMVIKEYDPSQFIFHKMINHSACEQSIYCVKCDDSERVGWIFPVQSMLSCDHSFANNEHFQKQVYVAYYLLIKENLNSIIEAGDGEFFLEDFITIDQQVLLLEQSLLSGAGIDCFEIRDYLPSLLAYGYTIQGNFKRENALVDVKTNLRIKKMSAQLSNNPYVITLFKELIPAKMDSLSKFHILYQAIEVMITIIFENDFKRFISDISQPDGMSFLNEKEENLKNMINEKARVNTLLDESGRVICIDSEKRNNLKNACMDLCKKYSYPLKGTSLHIALYGARCFLVHNAYKLDASGLEEIREINDYFLDALVDMVTSFSYT